MCRFVRLPFGFVLALAITVPASADEELGPVEEWQIRGVLRALKSDEYPRVRLYSAELVRGISSRPKDSSLLKLGQQAISDLRDLLKDQNSSVRTVAALALSQVGDKDDAPVFRDLLKDNSDTLRKAAAEALGRMGGKDDAPALRNLLQDKDYAIHVAAAQAIVQIWGKDGAPAIRDLLKDKD
jgi:HEAT repeat protein